MDINHLTIVWKMLTWSASSSLGLNIPDKMLRCILRFEDFPLVWEGTDTHHLNRFLWPIFVLLKSLFLGFFFLSLSKCKKHKIIKNARLYNILRQIICAQWILMIFQFECISALGYPCDKPKCRKHSDYGFAILEKYP